MQDYECNGVYQRTKYNLSYRSKREYMLELATFTSADVVQLRLFHYEVFRFFPQSLLVRLCVATILPIAWVVVYCGKRKPPVINVFHLKNSNHSKQILQGLVLYIVCLQRRGPRIYGGVPIFTWIWGRGGPYIYGVPKFLWHRHYNGWKEQLVNHSNFLTKLII